MPFFVCRLLAPWGLGPVEVEDEERIETIVAGYPVLQADDGFSRKTLSMMQAAPGRRLYPANPS
jgi:hypothetical protein